MFSSSAPIQRPQSLREQTYQVLRASILSGELGAGSRLVEAQIAEKLQVSRTPIREALQQLQKEQLIVTDKNGNLRVISFSPEDARHLYRCRLALEQESVPMKKFSPPQMKEVSFPTPHTLHPLSSQEITFYLFSPLPNS